MSGERPLHDDHEPICPRCGTPSSPGQEYCLECGFRLRGEGGLVERLAAAWRDRFGWYPGDWIWPAVLGLLIAIAGAATAIVVVDTSKGDGGTIVATGGGPPHAPTAPPRTATVEVPSVPRGTPSTTGPPQTPTNPPPATTTAPRPGSLVPWPAGRSGFTVVLESVPIGASRSLALSRARAASRAGLPQVGVLDSGRYSSLHPGYYVVFSGIYPSRSAADAARERAVAQGFTAAYSRQITQ